MDRSPYRSYRFPPEIIAHAVWLYFHFHLSLRDAQDLLAERGIIVNHETIRAWCSKFGPSYAAGLRRRRARAGRSCRPANASGCSSVSNPLSTPVFPGTFSAVSNHLHHIRSGTPLCFAFLRHSGLHS
jgi:hypothetical protein